MKRFLASALIAVAALTATMTAGLAAPIAPASIEELTPVAAHAAAVAAHVGNICDLQVIEDFTACTITVSAAGGLCPIGIAIVLRAAGNAAIASAEFGAVCPEALVPK